MAKTTIPAGYFAAGAITATDIADNSITIAKLNVSDGTSGQVLSTNGSGTLSFTDNSVGTTLTVVGRSANTSVSISNATLTVVGRSANVSVGVS